MITCCAHIFQWIKRLNWWFYGIECFRKLCCATVILVTRFSVDNVGDSLAQDLNFFFRMCFDFWLSLFCYCMIFYSVPFHLNIYLENFIAKHHHVCISNCFVSFRPFHILLFGIVSYRNAYEANELRHSVMVKREFLRELIFTFSYTTQQYALT